MVKKKQIRILNMPGCMNDSSNAGIAKGHLILDTEHDEMVKLFTKGKTVKPKTIDINYTRIKYKKNCAIHGIKAAFDPTDNRTNKDVKIRMARFSSLSAPHKNYFVMFSIHTFKGMRDHYNVKTLELRKAYRKEGRHRTPVIVLKGLDKAGKPVFYGDLTNMIPFTWL